jgi:SulP family sulfate permease
MRVCLSGVRGPVRDFLFKWHVFEQIGEENLFPDDAAALEALDNKLDPAKRDLITPVVKQTSSKN